MKHGPVWTPPRDPNPTSILSEARDDTAAGRYEVALVKHLWYHENALKFDDGQAGVRLSFALSDWLELAKLYPPAMEALRSTRDLAEQQVRAGHDAWASFNDFDGINQCLNENRRTVELFRWLSIERLDDAKAFVNVAQDALMAEGEHELLIKHIDPEQKFDDIGYYHRASLRSVRGDALRKEALDRLYARKLARLVALLVVLGRRSEAERHLHLLDIEREDDFVREAVARALKGESS